MLNQEEYMEVKILQRQGKSIREIARNLGISRNTVRTYLRSEKPFIYQRRTRVASKLDPYKKQIIERIKEAHPIRIPATVIYREIRKQGYQGKERIVQYFLRELYEENQPKEQLVRFETPPGKQMQVDWTILQGGKNRLLAFAGVLGYSRSAYVEFVFSETLDMLLKCHENSFEYFGGVPEEILYDNMKTVVTERDRYGKGKHGFQKEFWDFAKHYGFMPRLCRPYRAKTKGKVERFIRYLKESFYNPFITQRKEIDLFELNYEVKKWLKEIADLRLLRDFGERPIDRIEKDRKALQSTSVQYTPIKREKVNLKIRQHDLTLYDNLRRYA